MTSRTLSLTMVCLLVASTGACAASSSGDPTAVWFWPAVLFVACTAIGTVAVIAGLGGGVLFVPLVGTFMPFHIDFVRGAALFVALAGSMTASTRFVAQGITFPRLVLPLSLACSAGAIIGAIVGLSLDERVVRILLGLTVLSISMLMLRGRGAGAHSAGAPDPIAGALRIEGSYVDTAEGNRVDWRPRRMGVALVLFTGVGVLAGMFGLGAGWANVPILNLVMQVPLKAAVASSLLSISISDAAPAFIYLNSGAVLAELAVPSVLGMMLGSAIGARLVGRIRTTAVRVIVIALLALSGLVSLARGLGLV